MPLFGCHVHPAPEKLDELLRALWVDATTGDVTGLRVDAQAAPDLIDVDALLKSAQSGGQSPLIAQDVDALDFIDAEGNPRPAPDVSETTGLYVVDRFACEPEVLAKILTWPDQNALFKTYTAYERTYDGKIDAFVRGETATLGWQGEIEAHIPLAGIGTYVYDFETRLRRLPLPHSAGDAFVIHTWMAKPATWAHESPGKSFLQDYEVELYLPLAPDDWLHVYPIWRDMKLAAYGDMASQAVGAITTSQMIKYDKTLANLCAEPPF